MADVLMNDQDFKATVATIVMKVTEKAWDEEHTMKKGSLRTSERSAAELPL